MKTNCQQEQRKPFSITTPQGKANQKHQEPSSHSSWTAIRKQKATRVGKDKKEHVQCWWKHKLAELLWKTKKLKQSYHVIQQFHSWVHTQRKWSPRMKEMSALPCLSSTIHNSKEMEITYMFIQWWIKKMWYTYTLDWDWQKRWNLVNCNMDGTKCKWSTERQAPWSHAFVQCKVTGHLKRS